MGKTYISSPEKILKQKPQKGQTCFYYGLPPHEKYGKAIDDLEQQARAIPELSEDVNIKFLLEGRRREKIISAFRKAISNLEDSAFQTLQGKTKICKLIEESLFQLNDKEINAVIPHYMQMAKHNFQLNQMLGNSSSAPIDCQLRSKFALMRRAMWHTYGLKATSWRPENGFLELISELKKNGALTVAGRYGESCYTSWSSVGSQTFGGRKVHYWRPGTYIHTSFALSSYRLKH